MFENASNKKRNRNEIVKYENNKKDGWIENCRNGMSFVSQIGLKKLNPNVNFLLYYITNLSHYGSLNTHVFQCLVKNSSKRGLSLEN